MENNFNDTSIRENRLVQSLINSIPAMLFAVDEDVRILASNLAAAKLLGVGGQHILKRAGEVLHCIHSELIQTECGATPFCQHCPIRRSVQKSIRDKIHVREVADFQLFDGYKVNRFKGVIITSPLIDADDKAMLMIADLHLVTDHQHFFTICSHCRKKIKSSHNIWVNMETFFRNFFNVTISHGVCQSCYKNEIARIDGLKAPKKDRDK